MGSIAQTGLQDLFAGAPGRVHLMGICGVGVAGVARLLAARGWQVSGCDASPDGAMARWLQAQGLPVTANHDASHIVAPGAAAAGGAGGLPKGLPTVLIHTAAVPSDHPEIVRARAAGYTVCRRGEALAALVDSRRGVAVCGAHGKTTTTCFTTRLLQELGSAPSWCIGGSTVTLGGVAGVGASDLLVVEADESDGTLALYHPAVTVLNNIDLDHLEHFDGEAALIACYQQAVRQTRHGLAYGVDDARAVAVARDFRGPQIAFGFGAEAALRATQLELAAHGITFSVLWQGALLGRVSLDVPGRHNALNALGALAAAILLGHTPATALARLSCVAELPARRFERLAAGPDLQVISDYAHHPAEIAALVAAARLQGARRVIALFQPHRYTRTRALGAEFPAAFEGVDELMLAPVYAASEAPLEAGGIADLHAHFRRLRPAMTVLLARSLDEAWAGLRRRLRPGDLLLVAGAGDVVRVAGWAAAAAQAGSWGEHAPLTGRAGAPTIFDAVTALAQIPDVTVCAGRPLAGLTFYGVGGPADLLVEVATPAALAALLAWTGAHGVPVHRLGRGANTWASDLGVAGVVVRLAGEAFRGWVRQGADVMLGCGWNGPALLDRLEAEGLAGLEFLEGVPGQVGGWLAMNAGAHGGEIGAQVVRFWCWEADGTGGVIEAEQAGFGYRCCTALTNRIAWQVTLRLLVDTPAAIRARRQAFRERRLPLAGLRTAGSVFCNPPGDFAGRLLEAAGCKGLRVGGAMVSERHANIVVAGDDATASDILALLALMRQRVQTRAGVRLELENRMLGFTDVADGLAMD
jgi:UDP-N-acetylmuramate--L-alanine ligase/UDP-N-acetylenolpyruvoylglucosamine reductase